MIQDVHQPSPACITLSQITMDRVELCQRVPPPGDSIPVETDPFPIDESIPSMDYIEWVERHLQQHRSGGVPGMRAEHIKS